MQSAHIVSTIDNVCSHAIRNGFTVERISYGNDSRTGVIMTSNELSNGKTEYMTWWFDENGATTGGNYTSEYDEARHTFNDRTQNI